MIKSKKVKEVLRDSSGQSSIILFLDFNEICHILKHHAHEIKSKSLNVMLMHNSVVKSEGARWSSIKSITSCQHVSLMENYFVSSFIRWAIIAHKMYKMNRETEVKNEWYFGIKVSYLYINE